MLAGATRDVQQRGRTRVPLLDERHEVARLRLVILERVQKVVYVRASVEHSLNLIDAKRAVRVAPDRTPVRVALSPDTAGRRRWRFVGRRRDLGRSVVQYGARRADVDGVDERGRRPHAVAP